MIICLHIHHQFNFPRECQIFSKTDKGFEKSILKKPSVFFMIYNSLSI